MSQRERKKAARVALKRAWMRTVWVVVHGGRGLGAGPRVAGSVPAHASRPLWVSGVQLHPGDPRWGGPRGCHQPAGPSERASPFLKSTRGRKTDPPWRLLGQESGPWGPPGGADRVLGHKDLQTQPLTPLPQHQRPPLGQSCQVWNFYRPLDLGGIPLKSQPPIETPHFCTPELYDFFC